MVKRRISDLILVLALFAVYATGAMALAAIGSNTYRHTTEVMQEDYDLRTGVLYIAEKVRQNDVGGGVRLDAVGGESALVLTEQVADRSFETWIFIEEGQLCELSIASGAELNITQAQRIMPMQSMKLELNEWGLLEVALATPDDVASAISLNVKCGSAPFLGAASLRGA
jgi:hypothetical protein